MRDGGTNFAVQAAAADAMLVCLFDGNGAENQIPLLDYDAGVWHGFVPRAGAGQAYGYRAVGRYDPGSGLRCNPAKLLLDPYARALTGTVIFGPGWPRVPNPHHIAAAYASRTPGYRIEAHPADWRLRGRAAGQLRNAKMIALGADGCVAFLRGASLPFNLLGRGSGSLLILCGRARRVAMREYGLRMIMCSRQRTHDH